jgi:hypothetical protein
VRFEPFEHIPCSEGGSSFPQDNRGDGMAARRCGI